MFFIYKINKDGTRKKWRHLDKCSDRWFSSLSDFDFGTIDTLVNVR